jgi:hypothetical protein
VDIVKQIAGLKLKLNENKIEVPEDSGLKEITRRLRIQNKKLLEQVSGLKVQVVGVKAERNSIQKRYLKLSSALSGALGSCGQCWGEDPDCPVCRGKGSSGWRTVNKSLFNLHVLPTLEKKYGLDIRKTTRKKNKQLLRDNK